MRTLVWVLLCVLPPSQQPPRDPSLSTNGTAIVRGRVTAGDSGAPIPLAFVILNSTDLPRSLTTHTDDRGRFEFRNVAAARYHLQVEPPEFRSHYLRAAFGGDGFFGRGYGFDVAAGDVRDGVDVVLPVSAAISGRVLDEAGEPLARVGVQALKVLGNGGRLEPAGNNNFQSDDLGRFRFFGLSAGDYLLKAIPEPMYMRAKDSPSPAFIETFYPSAASPEAAVKVRVEPGQDVDGFDILLARTKTFRISGVVLDPDGQPWGNAGGDLQRFQGNGEELRIDAAGRFAVSGLVPGTYQISVSPPFEGRNGYGSTRVSIADTNVENIVISTSPAVDLRGTVAFENDPPKSLSRFSVDVTQIDPQNEFQWIPLRAFLNADASFLLNRLHGPSILRARPPDGWHLKAVLLDGKDITDTPTEFRDRDSGHVVVVLTERGAAIEGTVTDQRGQTISDCDVLLFSADPSDWTPYSSRGDRQSLGRNSRFRFAGVRPGKYLMAAVPFDQVSGVDVSSAATLQSLARDATPVTVGQDQQVDVTLKLIGDPR